MSLSNVIGVVTANLFNLYSSRYKDFSQGISIKDAEEEVEMKQKSV